MIECVFFSHQDTSNKLETNNFLKNILGRASKKNNKNLKKNDGKILKIFPLVKTNPFLISKLFEGKKRLPFDW